MTSNFSRGLPMGPATTESSSMVGYIKGRTSSDVITYPNDFKPVSASNVYAGTLVFQNRKNASATTTRSRGVVLKRPKIGGDNLPAVQANFYKAKASDNTELVFTGVTYDASEDGTMSHNTHLYNETGISILQTGIVNVYCDEDVAEGARFGDTVYWVPEPCKTQHRGLPDDFRPVKLKLGASNKSSGKPWVEKETTRPVAFVNRNVVYNAFMDKKYNNYEYEWFSKIRGNQNLSVYYSNLEFVTYVIGEHLVSEEMLKNSEFLKKAKDLGINKKDIKKHFMYDPVRGEAIDNTWKNINSDKAKILSGNIGTEADPIAPPEWLVDYVKNPSKTDAGFAKESVVQTGSKEEYSSGNNKDFTNIVGVIMKSYPTKAVIQVMLVGDIQFGPGNITDPKSYFPLRLPVSIPIPRNPVYIRVFCESHLWTQGMLMFRNTGDNLITKYDIQKNPLITVTPFIKENVANQIKDKSPNLEKFRLVGVARDISPEFHGTPSAGHHIEEHPDHITNMMIDGHTTIIAHPMDVKDVMVNDTVMWSFKDAKKIDYPEPLKSFLDERGYVLPRVVKFDGEHFDRIIGKVSEKYGGHEARLEVLLTFTRGQQGFLTKTIEDTVLFDAIKNDIAAANAAAKEAYDAVTAAAAATAANDNDELSKTAVGAAQKSMAAADAAKHLRDTRDALKNALDNNIITDGSNLETAKNAANTTDEEANKAKTAAITAYNKISNNGVKEKTKKDINFILPGTI